MISSTPAVKVLDNDTIAEELVQTSCISVGFCLQICFIQIQPVSVFLVLEFHQIPLLGLQFSKYAAFRLA